MLAELQRQLSDIYQVSAGHDVRDYLVTDPMLAGVLAPGALLSDSEESLLISEDEEGLALSLFLDAGLLARVEDADPLQRLRSDRLDDLWKVLEGLSHFNCMVWKAAQDRAVSLLELELQGEIDKFVSTALLAVHQSDVDLLYRLHGYLFDNVRFHDDLAGDELERYRSASDYAARFCHGLRRQLLDDDQRMLEELRRFYRLQFGDKISHIHSRAWQGS